MKKVLITISYLSLAAIVMVPVLFYLGRISLETNKLLLMVATVIWFVSALFWMGREKTGD